MAAPDPPNFCSFLAALMAQVVAVVPTRRGAFVYAGGWAGARAPSCGVRQEAHPASGRALIAGRPSSGQLALHAVGDDTVDLDAPDAGGPPTASAVVEKFLSQVCAAPPPRPPPPPPPPTPHPHSHLRQLLVETYSGDIASMYPLLSPDFLESADPCYSKLMKQQPYTCLEYIARFEITSVLSLGMPEAIVRTRVRPTNLPVGGPMWVEFVFKVKGGRISSFEPVMDENGWVRAPKSGGRV